MVARTAVDSLRRGHPWIYQSAVVRSEADAPVGSIVEVVSERGDPIGWGVFDPTSPIAVRLWTNAAQHTGPKLGPELFRERLTWAIRLRERMFEGGRTTAYRLLNGEGDRTPGFVIDRYDDIAVLRCDGAAAHALKQTFFTVLCDVLRAHGITTLLDRAGSHGDAKTIDVRFGTPRDRVQVFEDGVPFVVDPMRGQKTGAFLDQRENRRRVFELVTQRTRTGQGVRVLNLFSYTGGFSVRAALAGASVTSVDSAAAAHATAQESFRLAGVDPTGHAFVTADAFAWLAEAKRRGSSWNVVICDPPSFAPSEGKKARALTAYRALHRACADVVAPGGHLLAASCSSHVNAEDFLGTLDDAALGRSDLRVLELFGAPADHPTLAAFPEGRYLKLAVLA